jgi:hypothetical protein
MRLFFMLTICAGMACAQDTGANMQCVERLQIPKYPPLAHEALITGTVMATVGPLEDGTPQIKTSGHPLLTKVVENALQRSIFRKTCSGKSVKLIFNFDFDEDPLKAVTFEYPNQFSITAPHPVAHID